ncbi:hypothetical protein QZH41_005056 [Actinostola sp. cb2023]|nr:hypothetical protein QZH41_005056 [Actinostola sp. cb2023]
MVKRKGRCPGCKTETSKHSFGTPGPLCTGRANSDESEEYDLDLTTTQPSKVKASPQTTADPASNIQGLLTAVKNLSRQVDALANDNKHIKDQLYATRSTQNNEPVPPPNTNSTPDPQLMLDFQSNSTSTPWNKIKVTIHRGEYVNFTDLLRAEGALANEGPLTVVNENGVLIAKRVRNIDSFDTRLTAWFKFEELSMMSSKYSYTDLAKYRSVIHSASRKFRWSAVYAYDIRFRSKLAAGEIASFGTIDHTLYTTTLDATALRPDAKQCFRCKAYDHEARDCPFRPQDPAAKTPETTPRATEAWKRDQWTHEGKEGCNLYQRKACHMGAQCRRAHVCKTCKGSHPLADCPKST